MVKLDKESNNKKKEFIVPADVWPELEVLVAAYMSYFLSKDNNPNRSRDVNCSSQMIVKLLALFLGYPNEKDKRFQRKFVKAERPGELLKCITKEDNTIMDAEDQMDLLTEKLTEREGKNVVAYFYNFNDPQPFWRSSNETAQLKLPVIFYKEGRNAGKHAGTNKQHPYCPPQQMFCLNCNQIYQNASTHGSDCEQRCRECFGMGFGFPCQPDGVEVYKCEQCRVIFHSKKCYDNHHRLSCNKKRVCEECDREYHTGNGKHICGNIHCLQCHQSHLNLVFKYCINELLAHLNKTATANIAFCFTRARSTNYRLGNTMAPLNRYIDDLKENVKIILGQETVYLFDNEAFRFLCLLNNGEDFTEVQRSEFERSWETSVRETERLLDYFKHDIPPHAVRETISINEARNLILTLAKPLADISKNIHLNIKELEKHFFL